MKRLFFQHYLHKVTVIFRTMSSCKLIYAQLNHVLGFFILVFVCLFFKSVTVKATSFQFYSESYNPEELF